MAKRLTQSTANELSKIVEGLKQGCKEVVHNYVNPRGQCSEAFAYSVDTLVIDRHSDSELRIRIGHGLHVSFHIGGKSPSRHEDAVMFDVRDKELRMTTVTPSA